LARCTGSGLSVVEYIEPGSWSWPWSAWQS
jgi:hypothetical protein